MIFRLILTLVLVPTVIGCMPEEIQDVNQEQQKSGKMQNHRTDQDEKTEELYLPGQD